MIFNKVILFSFKKTAFFLLFILPLVSSSQVIIDKTLLENSDVWKPKIALAVIANSLKKVSIGPLETVEIEKGEKNVIRSRERSFIIENGRWGFVRDYHIEKRQPFDLTAVYNNQDSVFINMQMVTSGSGRNNGLIHGKKQLAEDVTSSIFCEETIIETNHDTTRWVLKRSSTSEYFSYEVEKSGIVSSAGDMITIHSAKGFRKKIYEISLPEGLVFMRNGQQIAAYQFAPKNLWLLKDLSDQDKQILGAAVIAILSDYRNSF